jgi:hypothetical protein
MISFCSGTLPGRGFVLVATITSGGSIVLGEPVRVSSAFLAQMPVLVAGRRNIVSHHQPQHKCQWPNVAESNGPKPAHIGG